MKEIVELSSNNTAAQANAFDMVIAMLDVSRCAGIFVQWIKAISNEKKQKSKESAKFYCIFILLR